MNNAHLEKVGETLQKENENYKAVRQDLLERMHGSKKKLKTTKLCEAWRDISKRKQK